MGGGGRGGAPEDSGDYNISRNIVQSKVSILKRS